MVETSKQVRVDNWGIYFLQRLQLFFSKTDYCDLTLQFEGNVQLKVHRLVMNACTEYFAFLEQTCPAMDENTIMMPADLQADVIVPIVNFMYTGMLEFHPSIYDKLYKAAEIMNIAVLTKLLEAQLAPVSKMSSRAKRDKEKDTSSWKEVKKVSKPSLPLANDLPAPLPGKKVPVWKKRAPTNTILQSHPASATFATSKWSSDTIEKDTSMAADNTPKPTRFEWPDDDLAPISAMYPSFDDVSLTSKPLWTKEDEQKAAPAEEHPKVLQYPPRRNSSNSVSQDYDDEFSEKEQKVTIPQLEESSPSENSVKRKAENKITSSPKRVKISNHDEETVISITTSNPSEVDHTKIVSEILKKYPDLVKKKRNIKLKITQSKTTEQAQIKVQTVREKVKPQLPSPAEKVTQPVAKEVKREPSMVKDSSPAKEIKPGKRGSRKASFRAASEEGPWTCMECFGQDRDGAEFVLYYLFRKHMADQHQVEFDSTLCKYCGKKCIKTNYMVYHLYTKHGLKPPRDVVFPKCDYCPFIAVTTDRLQEHMKTHGKDEAQCMTCQLGFLTTKDLLGHQQIAGHSNRSSSILDCAYCMKKRQSPVTLFTHVRAQHMKEARRDGVTSLDEVMDIQSEETDDDTQERDELADVPHSEKNVEIIDNRVDDKQLVKDRVKILSNVQVARSEDSTSEKSVNKVANPSPLPDPEPENVAVTTTAATLSNIGGSLATNLGLVDIVVLDDNQQYILQQPQGQPGNAEFILPPELAGSEGILQAAAASGELNSTDELVMVLTDHDYQEEQIQGQSDNSNIVVLYSHPVEGQQGQFITSQGNLLVNSEGMLEIRNGASITTTAGQILVNNDSTTTTQATESPIESIDLIRKEIEGSDDLARDRESIKTVLRKKGKEINKLVKEVNAPPVEEANEHHAENSIVSNYDEGKNVADETLEAALDTTDSTIQEEPMDVDEIVPQQKEALQLVDNAEQEENQMVNPIAESTQSERIEETNNEISTEEDQGQDVPPDINRISQVNPQTEEPVTSGVDSKLVMNDPENFQEKNVTETLPQVEQMEVDSGKPTETCETASGLDEMVSEVPDNPEIPSNIENPLQIPHENHPEENQTQELFDEQTPEETNNHQEPIHSEEDQSSEINQDQNIANNQDEPNLENDKECIPENFPETPIEHSQEESDPLQVENDVNDSNDNIQPNYDDFTDESQQSSSQKTHKDLNKEILEDWEDTDSQQSQSQEPDSQEPEPDQAALNAAENVNKLMDDWDEEDEDQTKE